MESGGAGIESLEAGNGGFTVAGERRRVSAFGGKAQKARGTLNGCRTV